MSTTILTGPVHSGKSTAVCDWASQQPSGTVVGFATPTHLPPCHGKKLLLDLTTSILTRYEEEEEVAADGSTNIAVGKYFLNAEAFNRAEEMLTRALALPDHTHYTFVLDELGKLELPPRSAGHHSLVLRLLKEWRGRVLLVVRDGLLDDVIGNYLQLGAAKQEGRLRVVTPEGLQG